jgi:hypothetical protein
MHSHQKTYRHLFRFIYDNRRYKTEELVAIVKRMKEWGPDDDEPDDDLMEA